MTNKKRIQKLINKKYRKQKEVTLKATMITVRRLEKELRNIPIGSKMFACKAKELRKARFKMRWLQSSISELFESDPMKNPIEFWKKKNQEMFSQIK